MAHKRRDESSQDWLAAILADLAAASGLDVADIAVERLESVTWRDGSLGCPEPGMFYTQALVEGFRVILAAGGKTHDYRVDRAGRFRRCDHPADELGDTSVGSSRM